jgi:hypothetical protein
MRASKVVAALALLLVVGMLAACSGGGSDEPDGDEIARKIQETIEQPGLVYHAVGDDSSEVWIDAVNRRYRKKDSATEGRLVSVGEEWTQIYYDPFSNTVASKDLSPRASAAPRVNNPAVGWSDALGALAYSATLDVTTKSVIDGVEVWVLQAKTPIRDASGNLTGQLAARVEIDLTTNLPHAYEKRDTLGDGSTPTPDAAGVSPNHRVVYTTSEMIARDSLAADFFDQAIVAEQLQTPEQNLEKIRALGLEPLWLGTRYEGTGGFLQLPADTGVFAVSENGEIHYSLIIPISATEANEQPDSVIIRLSKDQLTFKPPDVPEFGGDLPEQLDEARVNGSPALLYTSTLTTADLPCPDTNCPPSTAVLYRRLIFAVGETGVQLETAARIGPNGQDANGYNTRDAIVALAEALSAPPAPVATPSPTPGLGPVS